MPKFQFKPHIIDQNLPRGAYAQTALADLDNDGRLEFIIGQQYGIIFWYKYHTPDQWTRHLLGENSPSDVGGCVLDVDGDGSIDYVAGGAWYCNSRDPQTPFERHVFDPELTGVHDVIAADIDGDGHMEIITMSDQNDLRWYKIPPDPAQLWVKTVIGPAVHAGVAIGDVDGDGDLDIVRTNVWFENVKGDGTKWQVHVVLDANLGGHEAVLGDITGSGRLDIIAKPWQAHADNALGGEMFVVFLENVSPS